jgi:protein SCO1
MRLVRACNSVQRKLSLVLTILCVCATGCARGQREYELHGQVLAVDPDRREITIKHDDIRGFMPGMTMPFKVREGTRLDGWTPGDLVDATLLVSERAERGAYLTSLRRIGHAPLSEAPPVRPAMDLLNSGETIPDVSLVDEHGQRHRVSEWRGTALAITFIYTRCPLPDFCPVMDRRFAEVQRQLSGDQTLSKKIHLLSISFDPAFDTPEVLGAHAKSLGADSAMWSFLTGDAKEVERFALRFGVSVIRDGSATEVVHNLRTAVVDGNGRLVRILGGTDWQAQELIAELRNAVGGGR